jgi:hypothetical protein
MATVFAALASGLLFGLGLTVSQMLPRLSFAA